MGLNSLKVNRYSGRIYAERPVSLLGSGSTAKVRCKSAICFAIMLVFYYGDVV